MPMQSVLSLAAYFAQFCLSVVSAAFSSARQASLLRPSTTAPRPAASQLGPTCRVGGPPPPPRPSAVRVCDRDCGWDVVRGGTAGCDCACGWELPSGFGCSSFCTAGGRSLSVGWRCPTGAWGTPPADGAWAPGGETL